MVSLPVRKKTRGGGRTREDQAASEGEEEVHALAERKEDADKRRRDEDHETAKEVRREPVKVVLGLEREPDQPSTSRSGRQRLKW